MCGRAFRDAPHVAQFFPHEQSRLRNAVELFRVRVRFGLLYGVVHRTSPGLEGTAAWLPSEKATMSMGWQTCRGGMRLCRALAFDETSLGTLGVGLGAGIPLIQLLIHPGVSIPRVRMRVAVALDTLLENTLTLAERVSPAASIAGLAFRVEPTRMRPTFMICLQALRGAEE